MDQPVSTYIHAYYCDANELVNTTERTDTLVYVLFTIRRRWVDDVDRRSSLLLLAALNVRT